VAHPKTTQVFANLSPELLAEVKTLAAADNRTLSGFIRAVLADRVRKEAAVAARRNGR
jgi:hypothetical protein